MLIVTTCVPDVSLEYPLEFPAYALTDLYPEVDDVGIQFNVNTRLPSAFSLYTNDSFTIFPLSVSWSLTFSVSDEATTVTITESPELAAATFASARITEELPVDIRTLLKSFSHCTSAPIDSPSILIGIKVRFIELIEGTSKVSAVPFTVITFERILCTIVRPDLVKVIVSVSLFQSTVIPKYSAAALAGTITLLFTIIGWASLNIIFEPFT